MKNIANKEKIIEIFGFVLIFCVFMGSNFIKFNFFGVNFNIARIMMLISSMIIFKSLIKDIISKKKNIFNVNKNIVKYCIIFFVIWSLISICTIYKTLDLYNYVITNFFICIGTVNILYFIKFVEVDIKKNIIFNMVNIPVFFNCLYYLFLYHIKGENVGGLYHNSNDLATVLLLTIPASIFLIIHAKKYIFKFYNGVFLIVYVLCFYNIMSRACIIGLLFAILMFCIIAIIKNRKIIMQNKKIKILFLLCIFICVCAGVYIIINYIGKICFSPIKNARTSNEIRMNLIYNGLYFLIQDYNFLFGIGAGNNTYYLKHYSIYSINNIYNFHNFWIDILVGYGVIIFTCFIIIYSIMCRELYKKFEKNFYKKIDCIFLFFLLSFIIASISSSSIITREWLWLLFAMIISYINHKESKEV